ncbi:hypothetical protein PMAYCL1PPCAC_26462, partial [Pristionchus mayeri]
MEDGDVRGNCQVCQSRLCSDQFDLSKSYGTEHRGKSEEEVRTDCDRDRSAQARSEYRIRHGSRQERETYDHPEGENHRDQG